MRRLLSILIVLICAVPAFGATYWTLTFDNQPIPAELPPLPVGENTLLVSARSLCQALHVTYDYDAASGLMRVSHGGTVLEMHENLPQAKVNGREVRMPVPARKESGVMMLPVPFVAEIFGCRANVDGKAMTMALTSGGASAPAPSVSAQAGPVTLTATAPEGFVNPADVANSQRAVPSALPWLATGTLPPTPGFPQTATSIPQMPTVAVQPAVLGSSVPTIGTQTPITLAANQGMQLPPIGSQPVPVLPAGSGGQLPSINGGGSTLPASGSVQLPPGAYQQADMRVAPGDRVLPGGKPVTPWVDNAITTAGKMDEIPSGGDIDFFAVPQDPGSPIPDPAITGLTMERRFDQFVNAYVVRYRITNRGLTATDKPLVLRLLVGGRGELQKVQDVRIDRLTPGQSLTFEWTGDARAYPGLYDIVVRAEVQALLDEQATDDNKNNNTRSVRLAY